MRLKTHFFPIITLVSFILGILLRYFDVQNIEYKSDEDWAYCMVQKYQLNRQWPNLGMPSGSLIKNPAMSQWLFILLSKLIQVRSPTDLALACIGLNAMALLTLNIYSLKLNQNEQKKTWLWTSILCNLNPFLILYQKKIWAQSLLPLFCILLFIMWKHRKSIFGSFFYGFLLTIIGQIHLSALFISLSIAASHITKRFFRDKSNGSQKDFKILFFFILGIIFPSYLWLNWLYYVYKFLSHLFLTNQLNLIFRPLNIHNLFRPVIFWITTPFGLHLGQFLGVHRGTRFIDQLGPFLKFPTIHLVDYTFNLYIGYLTHAILIVLMLLFTATIPKTTWSNLPESFIYSLRVGIGLLIIMPFCSILAYRYYLICAFPFDTYFAVYVIRSYFGHKSGRVLLLWCVTLTVTVTLAISFIHFNGGSTQGDYGDSYQFSVFKKIHTDELHPIYFEPEKKYFNNDYYKIWSQKKTAFELSQIE